MMTTCITASQSHRLLADSQSRNGDVQKGDLPGWYQCFQSPSVIILILLNEHQKGIWPIKNSLHLPTRVLFCGPGLTQSNIPHKKVG